MSQTERLMAIIDKLSHLGSVTTKYITETFEISSRQARRDIEYIRDRIELSHFGDGVELIYDAQDRAYKLSGDKKDLEELLARSVISSAVASSSFDPLKEAFRDDVNVSMIKKVRYITQAAEMPDYSTFFSLMNAIESGNRVVMEYARPGKRPYRREFEPLELVNYSAIWYVRVFDLRMQALRTYSLSRIRSLKVLDEKITFSDEGALKRQDDAGFGIFLSDAEPKEYTMRFHGNVAYIVSAQIWHKKQSGYWVDDNTYQLTVPAVSDVEILAKVLSYGADAEPIAPEDFVAHYREEVKRLANKVGL